MLAKMFMKAPIMMMKRTMCAVFPALLLAMLLCPALAQAAAQAPAQNFTLSYAVYAGGFHALDTEMRFALSSRDYKLVMEARPYGVIGSLLPWAGSYTTKGHIANNVFIPDTHDKTSRWKEDNSQASFVYRNGTLVSLSRAELEQGKMRRENIALDPAFHKNSVDILSGALQLLGQATRTDNCSAAPVIFDGKQRFTLKFTDKGTEKLNANNYNIFSGTARICEVEMIPERGFPRKPRGYHKIQEEARTKGQLPRVWLGRLWNGGPYVPVKMLVKSEYGAVFLHIRNVAR
ncbi:MAG: hypothetical protein JWM96_807 [Alphaproteobacteria bacterium]|nr:hypothetical protein [Alphaproteobacteria bacterium]